MNNAMSKTGGRGGVHAGARTGVLSPLHELRFPSSSYSSSQSQSPPPSLPGIPTGFRPKARGWTALRAYPGYGFLRIHNPNGVAAGGRNPVGVGQTTRPNPG
jgi:hypothetical protein